MINESGQWLPTFNGMSLKDKRLELPEKWEYEDATKTVSIILSKSATYYTSSFTESHHGLIVLQSKLNTMVQTIVNIRDTTEEIVKYKIARVLPFLILTYGE